MKTPLCNQSKIPFKRTGSRKLFATEKLTFSSLQVMSRSALKNIPKYTKPSGRCRGMCRFNSLEDIPISEIIKYTILSHMPSKAEDIWKLSASNLFLALLPLAMARAPDLQEALYLLLGATLIIIFFPITTILQRIAAPSRQTMVVKFRPRSHLPGKP